MSERIESMSISIFRATCLAVLERVRRTRRPILITRRGQPVAQVVPPPMGERPPSWLGALRSTGRIEGDIVGPALDAAGWEAMRS